MPLVGYVIETLKSGSVAQVEAAHVADEQAARQWLARLRRSGGADAIATTKGPTGILPNRKVRWPGLVQ